MGEIRVRRATAAELLPLLEPLQPASVRAVSDLGPAATALRTRAHIAERGGQPAGALVVGEHCRGRWRASPVLWDTAAAPAVARLIDRGPAWEVAGVARNVEPLLPHLRRAAGRVPQRLPFYAVDLPVGIVPQDPRCRLAAEDDLEALVEVFSGYELDRIPTRPRLREFMARTLAHRPVWLIEEDDRIAGVFRCDLRTATYDSWTSTVLPEFRRRGLGNTLGLIACMHSAETGRRICAAQAVTNMGAIERVPTAEQWLDDVERAVWVVQPLQSPRRFPGHRRLRRRLERMEGPLKRRKMWALPFDRR